MPAQPNEWPGCPMPNTLHTHTQTHRRTHAHDFRLTIGNRADFAALNGCYRYPFRLYFMIKLLTAMAERFID